GAYEGASAHPYDIYRPTDNSLMRSGEELNVVGRNLIYKRVMNVVNNYNWKYDYDKFVKFDEPARTATRSVRPVASPWQAKRHAGPRLILK
ncbi:MAG: hypothetical protein HUJ99_07870, partial [Bacteroidaceae bacterium]|nr:hypothetical protein [Bacteroidaceae bacterium]